MKNIKTMYSDLKAGLNEKCPPEKVEAIVKQMNSAAKVGSILGLGFGGLLIIGTASVFKGIAVVGTAVVVGAGVAAGLALGKAASEIGSTKESVEA